METKKLDFSLLGIGLLLVCGPMALAHFDPTTYASSRQAIHMLTALGGGLIGTAIPGILQVEIKGVRAVGALGLVVLFYLYGPGSVSDAAKQPEAKSAPVTSSGPAVTGTPPPQPLPNPAGSILVNSPFQQGNNNTLSASYDQHKGPAAAPSK